MASDPRTNAAGQGRILEALGGAGECRVLYDDDMTERLALTRERFRWLAPRARSAGATPALYVRAPPARAAPCWTRWAHLSGGACSDCGGVAPADLSAPQAWGETKWCAMEARVDMTPGLSLPRPPGRQC